MEQFRQIGEIMGSLKALMVLKHEIPINQRQCCLLYDILALAFDTISEEIRQNLKLEERNMKWKSLELPMKELQRVFKEADLYIRYCLDMKDWWGRAISLHMNRDCIELHIHNLLSCFPVVIEAIEAAAEISGVDQDDMHKRRTAIMKKYDQEWTEPKLFHWKFGKQYLVPREICCRLDTAWKEDRWLLLEKVREKKMSAAGEYSSSKEEPRLRDLFLRKLTDAETAEKKLLPSHILVGAQDYFVRRRLGCPLGGEHYKEIHWLGENFALRTFYRDIETFCSDISSVLPLSHPNVVQNLCAFYDEDRKEGFLIMELMSKDLGTYIREHSGQRKRIPFTIPVAVDIMLQIVRGMEYLHSKKMYHGDLNPSKILLKPRNSSNEGLFLAKIMGFGMNSIKSRSPRPNGGGHFDIWLAPEVLAELEKGDGKSTAKYTEKADVYSFGMLCFELLTGKIPFQDGHLKGEKMVRNIRAGGRPLFSYPSPKYLANLTRKCWQTDPDLRPTFSSICRILRYIKKTLVINPDHGDPNSPPPLVDYCDMEVGYLKKFPGEGTGDMLPVSQVPFQMFAYRVIEKEKVFSKNWDLPLDKFSVHRPASLYDEERLAAMDDLFLVPSDRRSVCSEIINMKTSAISVDQRSVVSEIPQRKFLLSDQRSFGSESPGKRFSAFGADKRSIGAETPERKHSAAYTTDVSSPNFQSVVKKIDQKLNIQKPKVEVSDKAVVSKAGQFQATSTKLPDNNKFAVAKVTEQKPESTDTEKKQMPRMTVDNKPAISDSLELKSSSRSIGHPKLAEIPEKRTLQNPESNHKIASKDSAKKDDAKSMQKSGNTINSDKKPTTLIKKLKNMQTNGFPETLRNYSPTSSPAKKKITTPIISPSSSPARTSSPVKKKIINPIVSPASSPGRTSSSMKKKIKNPIVSPASSPGKTFQSGGTPKCTTLAPKNYASPMSSPLHPCSRLSRQTSLPGTSTQKTKLGHESDLGGSRIASFDSNIGS